MKKRYSVVLMLLACLFGGAQAEYYDLTAPVANFDFSFTGEAMKLELYCYDTNGLKNSIDRVDDPATIKSFRIVSENWNVTAYIDGRMLQYGQSETVKFALRPVNDNKPINFREWTTDSISFSADNGDTEYKLHYNRLEGGA